MIYIITAYIALKGSFFANGEVGRYNPDMCIVAAPPHIPLGTKVTITLDDKSLHCVVKDRMPYPSGTPRLDILFPSYEKAKEFGRQEAKIILHKS